MKVDLKVNKCRIMEKQRYSEDDYIYVYIYIYMKIYFIFIFELFAIMLTISVLH